MYANAFTLQNSNPGQRYYELAEKWQNGSITPQELEELESWFSGEQDKLVEIPSSFAAGESEHKQRVLAGIRERTGTQAPVRSIQWRRARIAVAAAVFVILSGTAWFFFHDTQKGTALAGASNRYTGNDVLPGGYKAKLTLSDGNTIVLDSAALGELAKQGNTAVINKDGQLIYDASHAPLPAGNEPMYNTVTTAKGETYSMILADGSVVTLNAGSTVHFPVVFSGNERRIQVTGEVYVKVAKDKTKPFIAEVHPLAGGTGKGLEVLALGTEFNINAYADDGKVFTTLVEGSVRVTQHAGGSTQNAERVTRNAEYITLKPGEQAVATIHSSLTTRHSPDMDKVLAWKNDEFIFDHDELSVIMRQLERWYDVEIVYQGVLPKQTLSGTISRRRNASAVLNMLKKTGLVNIKIEGKKIIVTP